MKLKFKLPGGFDWSLYILPFLLCAFGITIIYSITYGTSSKIAIDQIQYAVLGFVVAIALSFFDYRTLKGLYLILYILGLALLVAVLFLGDKAFGATRWINLGFMQLQPSEIFKLISIIILAKFFSDWPQMDWKKIVLIISLIALPLFLILIQPDLGTTTVVFVIFIAMLFYSSIKKSLLVGALALMLLLSPLAYNFLKPYQKDRITAFINPASDPHGAGYNVNQSKIAVGAGGLWGRGIGKGTQSQLNFLPVAHTDFIFAGTAEATGFVGSTALIALLTLLVIRTINTARIAKDGFGTFLALGIAAMFLFQILVNIGMNMGIMPVTGIPLPFVSYGGTAMLTNMIALGILQSIYIRHRKINF